MQETPHVRSSRKATPRFLGGRKHRVPSYVAGDGQVKRNVFCRKRVVAKLSMPSPARAGKQAAKPLRPYQKKMGASFVSFPPGEILYLSASSSSSKPFRGSVIPFAASLSQTTYGGTQYLLELFSVGEGHRVAPLIQAHRRPGPNKFNRKRLPLVLAGVDWCTVELLTSPSQLLLTRRQVCGRTVEQHFPVAGVDGGEPAVADLQCRRPTIFVKAPQHPRIDEEYLAAKPGVDSPVTQRGRVPHYEVCGAETF